MIKEEPIEVVLLGFSNSSFIKGRFDVTKYFLALEKLMHESKAVRIRTLFQKEDVPVDEVLLNVFALVDKFFLIVIEQGQEEFAVNFATGVRKKWEDIKGEHPVFVVLYESHENTDLEVLQECKLLTLLPITADLDRDVLSALLAFAVQSQQNVISRFSQ